MVDDQVENLLEHLKNLGLEEDTIVIFTSDNGPIGNNLTSMNLIIEQQENLGA